MILTSHARCMSPAPAQTLERFREPRPAWFPFAVCLLGLVFSGCMRSFADTPQERYDAVKAAFEKGDFAQAQNLGEAMVRDNQLSPQLFQLLGHIRYRQGDMGGATLWYSRAAVFPPPVPEIRQNITHIHDHTGNVRFTANRFLDQFAALLTRSMWARIAVISAWVLVFSIAFIVLFHAFSLRTLLALIAVLAAVTSAVCGLGWYWHPSYQKVADLAVVTATGAKAYTAATISSGSVRALPPGSEVRKLQDHGTWYYVEIPSEDEELRGWVRAETLTPFWPFDRGYLE